MSDLKTAFWYIYLHYPTMTKTQFLFTAHGLSALNHLHMTNY